MCLADHCDRYRSVANYSAAPVAANRQRRSGCHKRANWRRLRRRLNSAPESPCRRRAPSPPRSPCPYRSVGLDNQWQRSFSRLSRVSYVKSPSFPYRPVLPPCPEDHNPFKSNIKISSPGVQILAVDASLDDQGSPKKVSILSPVPCPPLGALCVLFHVVQTPDIVVL